MEKPQHFTRRKFGQYLGAAAATGVGAVAYSSYRDHKPKVPNVTEPVLTEENIPKEIENEEVREMSDSAWFKDQIKSYIPEFEIDMPIVLERKDVVETIQEKFVLKGIDRPQLRSSLEDLFIGIAINESRLDGSAMSSLGAFKWLQIMPNTWNDLAKDSESKESLEDNITVAVRLVEQEYRYLMQTCGDALARIQKEFFNDSEEEFDVYFFTPLLMNAYNAGMGTMDTVVNWFAEKFPNPEATVEAIGQSEILTGFDVFYLLANKGYSAHIDVDAPKSDDTPPAPNYRQDAATYTAKSYAAWWALKEAQAT